MLLNLMTLIVIKENSEINYYNEKNLTDAIIHQPELRNIFINRTNFRIDNRVI